MAGKYTPLENYLRGLPESQGEARLSFEQIEGILHFKLPASAYEDRRWWEHATEGNHVSARAWANAGWQIAGLDVDARWVKLARVATGREGPACERIHALYILRQFPRDDHPTVERIAMYV